MYSWLMLHKPREVVTSRFDPLGRATVYDLVPSIVPRLESVGRLDRDTTGLLLFSNEHRLAQVLLRPEHRIPRVYRAITNHPLPAEAASLLAAGLHLKDGLQCGKVFLEPLALPVPGCSYRITLAEGKHREVRRLAMHFGRRVKALHRLQFGTLDLGDLTEGQWRWLTPAEVANLRKSITRQLFALDAPGACSVSSSTT